MRASSVINETHFVQHCWCRHAVAIPLSNRTRQFKAVKVPRWAFIIAFGCGKWVSLLISSWACLCVCDPLRWIFHRFISVVWVFTNEINWCPCAGINHGSYHMRGPHTQLTFALYPESLGKCGLFVVDEAHMQTMDYCKQIVNNINSVSLCCLAQASRVKSTIPDSQKSYSTTTLLMTLSKWQCEAPHTHY